MSISWKRRTYRKRKAQLMRQLVKLEHDVDQLASLAQHFTQSVTAAEARYLLKTWFIHLSQEGAFVLSYDEHNRIIRSGCRIGFCTEGFFDSEADARRVANLRHMMVKNAGRLKPCGCAACCQPRRYGP